MNLRLSFLEEVKEGRHESAYLLLMWQYEKSRVKETARKYTIRSKEEKLTIVK